VAVTLDIYRNYGRENEKRETTTVWFEKPKDGVDIGRIRVQ